MAIGKAGIAIDIDNLSLKFGELNIIQGKLNSNYNEKEASDYIKNDNIEIFVDISMVQKILLVIQWI